MIGDTSVAELNVQLDSMDAVLRERCGLEKHTGACQLIDSS